MKKALKLLKILSLDSPYYVFNDPLSSIYKKYSLNNIDSRSLDIGCGISPRNPFEAQFAYGCDLQQDITHNVLKCDLSTEKLPYENNFFDVITAYDVIEHIPRVSIRSNGTQFPFVQLITNIYNALKDGGLFFALTPAYPFDEAFQDPTHVNIITEKTFCYYFCNDVLAKMYGFDGKFSIVESGWRSGKYFVLMKKIAL